MKNIISFALFLSTTFVHGQSFELDHDIKFTVKLPLEWVADSKTLDSPKGSYRQISFNKTLTTSDRKFAHVQIFLGDSIRNAIADQRQFGCDFGRYVAIDTILISGHKTIRWFGENCNWTKETNDDEVVGYSIESILDLKNEKYLQISSSYYSKDKSQLIQFKDEILALLSDITIDKN
jgi:hypothetical protein